MQSDNKQRHSIAFYKGGADSRLLLFRVAILQPLWLTIFCCLCFTSYLNAQSYTLDLVYCDFKSGPLTEESRINSTPLADGSVCQLIEDVGHDGISAPQINGMPSVGDQLLSLGGSDHFFLNGNELFHQPGFFYFPSAVKCENKFPAQIYIRIWNAPTVHQATAYWDSPLYRVVEGAQQFNLARYQLEYKKVIFTEEKNQSELNGSELKKSETADAVFALHDAYPNPFNAQSTITFELANSAHTKLVLYDILGREAGILLNEYVLAGKHQILLDASRLSSGRYFLTLTSGSYHTTTRNLNLLK